MSGDRWPAYELFLKSATTLAEHSDIPRGNAGAGLFAVAVTILAKEWGNARLAQWLHAQADSIGRCAR